MQLVHVATFYLLASYRHTKEADGLYNPLPTASIVPIFRTLIFRNLSGIQVLKDGGFGVALGFFSL